MRRKIFVLLHYFFSQIILSTADFCSTWSPLPPDYIDVYPTKNFSDYEFAVETSEDQLNFYNNSSISYVFSMGSVSKNSKKNLNKNLNRKNEIFDN